jgi:hypothetical protein
MTPFDLTTAHITQQPTTLYGLKYFPNLEPHCSNDQDLPNWGWPINALEISECNLSVVIDVLNKLDSRCQSIVEIGVHRNGSRSITQILMDHKPLDCKYLGIDIENKSYLDNPLKNIATIKANSHDKVRVRQKLHHLGIKTIDLLMIDGWHSVYTCVNDWGYTDMLSPYGAVVLHDTNTHPGCIALFNAVDDRLFDKVRYCTERNDMGISVFWHKNLN